MDAKQDEVEECSHCRTVGGAAQALDEFEAGPWSQRFPEIVTTWRRAWDRVISFFAFPPAVRKLIYTTKAIESLHSGGRQLSRAMTQPPN